MAAFKWSRRRGWVALTGAAACALVLGFLTLSTAAQTGKGIWGIAFVIAITAIAAVCALVATEGAPWDAEHWSAWLEPRPIAFVYLAVFGAFGVTSTGLALIPSPPAATDVSSPPRATRPATPRIRLKLPGIWGETGCSVTYRFVIRGRAVTVDSVRRPSGFPPHHLVATIVSAEGDVMHVTGDTPPRARGRAATFTYATNGVIERLTWNDQVRPVPLELDRCE